MSLEPLMILSMPNGIATDNKVAPIAMLKPPDCANCFFAFLRIFSTSYLLSECFNYKDYTTSLMQKRLSWGCPSQSNNGTFFMMMASNHYNHHLT